MMEILIGPTRRWREDALKNLPFMGQRAGGGRFLKDRPVLCSVRNNINRVLGRTAMFRHMITDLPEPTRSGKALSIAEEPAGKVRGVPAVGNREIVVEW